MEILSDLGDHYGSISMGMGEMGGVMDMDMDMSMDEELEGMMEGWMMEDDQRRVLGDGMAGWMADDVDPSSESDTLGSGSTIPASSEMRAPLEEALLQGVVPASAGVGSKCNNGSVVECY